jgi:DNA modification methylase
MIHCGDALTVLRAMPEASVDCCVTSPPYYGLRDYGLPASVWGGRKDCEHQWSDASWKPDRWGAHDDDNPGEKQQTNSGSLGHRGDVKEQAECDKCGAWRGCFGLEPNPQLYVEHAVLVFREVRRVLRDEGTLWLNLGDSFANDGKWGRATGGKHASGLHGEPVGRARRNTGLKPKDLIGVPWRVAFALQSDGWWLRSDIIWAKPAPMPESVTDRPTRSHEYIFLLTKSEKYYYDHEAIKEPAVSDHPSGNGYKRESRLSFHDENGARGSDEPWVPRKSRDSFKRESSNRAEVPGQPLREHRPNRAESEWDVSKRNLRDVWTIGAEPFPEAHFATFPPKLIEPCVIGGCPEGGTILDPFFGAGTTGFVARKYQRKFIGIELNPEYVAIAEKRMAQEVLFK